MSIGAVLPFIAGLCSSKAVVSFSVSVLFHLLNLMLLDFLFTLSVNQK